MLVWSSGKLALFSGVFLGEAGCVFAGVILGEADSVAGVVQQEDWHHDRRTGFKWSFRVAYGCLPDCPVSIAGLMARCLHYLPQ